MPPDIREHDHPLWIWARANLWGAVGVLVMLIPVGALFLIGPKDEMWFSVLLMISFLGATMVASYLAFKVSGKKKSQ